MTEDQRRKQNKAQQGEADGAETYLDIPPHLFQMEEILDGAIQRMDALEKKMEEYIEFQSEIEKLEAYYTGQQWKDDFAMDEEGKFPEGLKRGILSEDGIYDMLERNKELLDRIRGHEIKLSKEGNYGNTDC